MSTFTLETLRIGPKNQLAGSDSLYDAFYKIKNNFSVLANANFSDALDAGNGINLITNPVSNVITINNTGVLDIVSGGGLAITSSINGVYTITNIGPGSGTVTSIGITSNTVNVDNSPVTTSGNIGIELPSFGVAGTYTLPNVTVDNYGRIVTISDGNSAVVVDNLDVSNEIKLGDTKIGWSTLTTTDTVSSVLASISVVDVVGVKFFIRAHDTDGGTRYICSADVLSDGSNVEIVKHGGMSFGAYVGEFDVEIISGNINLMVTSASANTTVWTTQYSII